MERPIGDKFEVENGKILQVVEKIGCDLCFFNDTDDCSQDSIFKNRGQCYFVGRKDLKSVQFQLVKE